MRCLTLLLISIMAMAARADLLPDLNGLSPEETTAIESRPKIAAGLNPDYTLQIRPSKAVSCTLFYMVVAPNLLVDDWVFMAPWAPNLPSQKVEYVRSSPSALVAYDRSSLKRKLLVFKMKAGKSTRTTAGVKVFYKAQLYSRHLQKTNRDKNPNVKPLSSKDRNLFLRPGKFTRYTDPNFLFWSRSQGYVRKSREGEIDFARRVFQDLAANFKYTYARKMDRKLMAICKAGKSDCGGLSSLFVAIMRSEGIPARSLCGRWAKSSVKGQKIGKVPYFQTHVKAEFYAQGVGWVPVDLSSAILHDHSRQRLTYFGQDKGEFITMHLDAGFYVDTYHFGNQQLDWLQDIAFWVRGSGKLDGHISTGSWQVK